jgi:AraC-like DNA-binding protein
MAATFEKQSRTERESLGLRRMAADADSIVGTWHEDRIPTAAVGLSRSLVAGASLGDLGALVEIARAQRSNAPLGLLLGNYISLLERVLPGLRSQDLTELTHAISAMVCACCGVAGKMPSFPVPMRDLAKRERVCNFIENNLSNSDLRTSVVCVNLGVSRSQLYRLFEEDKGVVRYIRRRRLMRSHAILSDPSTRATIAVIADQMCFADPSTFTRSFKHQFGRTPRQVRDSAVDARPIKDTVSSLWRPGSDLTAAKSSARSAHIS